MTAPVVLMQLALDSLDFEQTLSLAEQTAEHVDIFEIGTPCIKHNGIELVRALKQRYPEKLVLVDLKTMDAGEYEAAPFYEAGADICTVLGVSGPATIAGVVRAANKYGAEVQVDLINVADKVACAEESAKLGVHIIGVHTGLDAQAAGQTPFADLQAIAELGLPVRISVAGGIKPATIKQVVDAGVDIVVVGAAIYGAPSPADAARKMRALADGNQSHRDMVVNKITEILEATDQSYADKMTTLVDGAKRIFIAGAGRSKLVGNFFAMRLVHGGYDVSVVGEIVTPSIKAGDLLVIISGSGETEQLISFAKSARKMGAKVILISSRASSTIGDLSEMVFQIGKPELYGKVVGMPMGTVFELSTLCFLEAIISHIIWEKGIPEEIMRERHANLE
jgi:3-hexulose-6-phosphate synthase/6-phospho-3-hexuloisomerase